MGGSSGVAFALMEPEKYEKPAVVHFSGKPAVMPYAP